MWPPREQREPTTVKSIFRSWPVGEVETEAKGFA